MKRKGTGDLGEKMAADFLGKKGYRILETNYRCSGGEIDIIASRKGSLAFVEVRTRTSSLYGSPEESITPSKMQHLETAAEHYLQNHKDSPESWQVHLVAVELEEGGRLKRIDLIENILE